MVDGIQKSLQNRKFCLTCSPWKNHNTSPNDPLKRKGRRYKDFSQDRKDQSKASIYHRALERKDQLIKFAGGSCKNCGYNKNRRALTFHHRDKELKLFGLSMNNLWSKSWEVILAEYAKCDLLCMNCHAEVESMLAGKTLVGLVNEKYGTNF